MKKKIRVHSGFIWCANMPSTRYTLLYFSIALIVAVSSCKSQQRVDATCAPEGGLTCNETELQICTDGAVKSAGACPGGCDDTSGVVRCKANNGSALAPVGAACRQGVTLCGVGLDSPALLTCNDGRMTKVASCPSGCIDEGETGALFCMGPKGGLRFHEGFQCPGFKKGSPEYACGPDGTSVLRCEAGKLVVASDRACVECYQAQATGAVSCKNAEGQLIDLATGEPTPSLTPLEPTGAGADMPPEPPPVPTTQNALSVQ